MAIFPRIVDYKGNAALQLVLSQTGEILFTSHKEGGQYEVLNDNFVKVFKTEKFSPGLITILLAKASWLASESEEGANDFVNKSTIIMPDGNVTDILTGNGDVTGQHDWLEAYVFKLSNDKLYPIYISTPDQSLKEDSLFPQTATLIEFFEINRDEVKRFDELNIGYNEGLVLFHENLTKFLATSGLSVHLLNIQEIGNEDLDPWVATVKLNGETYLLPDLENLENLDNDLDVVYLDNDPELVIRLDKVWSSKNLLVATTYLLDNNWQEILIVGEKGEVALFVSPNQPPSEMRAALEVYELHEENGILVRGPFTHSDRYQNYKPYYGLIDRLTAAWAVNKNDRAAYNEWIDAIVSMNQDQSGEETPYISPFATAAATKPVVRPASPVKEAMIDFLHPSGSFRQSSGGFGINEEQQGKVNENPFAANIASASFVPPQQQAQFQPAQAQFQPAQFQPQVSFVPAGTQFTPLSQPPSNVPLVAPVLRTSSNKGPRTASKDIIQGKTNFMDFSNGIKLTFPSRNNLTLTFNNGQLDSSLPLSPTQQSQIIDLIRQTYDNRNELLPRPEATASRYAQLKVDISPELTNEHKFYLQQLLDKRMAMAQEMQKLDSLLGLYGIKGRYVAPPTPAALNPADFPGTAREVGLLEYPIELIRIYQQIEKLV